MVGTYDVIVLGGGPTGEHAAGRARKRGLSVALVESDLVGGECSYYACIPSKTLLRPGAVLATARAVPGAREAVTGGLSASEALARRDWMISDLHDDGQQKYLESIGATLVRGHGQLNGERKVLVRPRAGEEIELEARRAVIVATGSTAVIPPIPGLAEAHAWTNREATTSEVVPKSMVVLGGGFVGVEMAQAWYRLGTHDVVVLEAAERLLMNAEPFAGELLKEAFQREGIDVETNARVASVTREANGQVRAVLADGREFSGDELLVATGRRPRTAGIGLESLGLETPRELETDDQLRVKAVGGDWLYAIGDVNGRVLLTHMGKYQARVAVDTIAGESIEAVADHFAVPAVTFTDPEIAAVGLTEAAARANGHEVRTLSCALESVPASYIWGEGMTGRCQLVVDSATEVIVGATFVGHDTAQLLHAATVAIAARVPISQLRHAVPSFPTLDEVWLELVESYVLPAEAPASA